MKGALFVKDWIASRSSVGLHPDHDHAMNVEMRKEWIRRRKERLDQTSSETNDSCTADFSTGRHCDCIGCAESEEEQEEESECSQEEDEEDKEDEDSDSY